MPTPLPPPPYQPTSCVAAPYNTIQNPNYATNAQSNINFPLNTGSNHSQVVSNIANTVLFNNINDTNKAIKATGSTTQSYMMFKSDQDRLKYIQAQSVAQTRVMAMNGGAAVGYPAAAATPTVGQICNNVFSIINS